MATAQVFVSRASLRQNTEAGAEVRPVWLVSIDGKKRRAYELEFTGPVRTVFDVAGNGYNATAWLECDAADVRIVRPG